VQLLPQSRICPGHHRGAADSLLLVPLLLDVLPREDERQKRSGQTGGLAEEKKDERKNEMCEEEANEEENNGCDEEGVLWLVPCWGFAAAAAATCGIPSEL